MKKLLFILAFLLIPMTAYSTTVTVAANSIANFQPTGLANDVTLSNVSVTNGFTTVSCSACFRPQWVGMSGFRIAISGVDYTVAGVTSTSVLTITTPYTGVTGSDKTVTWYKYVEVRIYADRAFQPAGASYVVQPGVPGSTSWYKRFAASIVNSSGVNTLYIPEFTIDSTTDAVGPTNQARYTAGFYRPDGSLVQLYSCFEQFRVPATTPTTWVALCQYNSPPAIVPPANEAYTKAQIDARFPSCTSGQMLYYAATGNAQACLNVGSGLTISSGTITAAGSTNIRNALNAVVDYGAVGDGVTDDTTAIQNCIDASEASGGYPCYIRAGTYLVTGLTLSDNGNIIGDGKTKTTIYSTTNSPLISTPTTANDASIRSIGFKGTKAAGSSQVGIQLDGSTYYYNLIIEDVKIEETGSFGINIIDPFSSSFRDIFIDDTAGFPLNYDAPVAPSNTFSNIYVGVVNVGATVGFRIRSGDFVCTECNGVNSSPTGGAWATVGKKNGVDGDTEDSAARFTCIHCNLESFAAYGIISYSSSKINLLGNTTIAGAGAGTEIALYFDNTGDGATGCTPSPACEYYSQFIARGYIDDTVDISDGYAAYANSQPIHTAKGFPAIQLLGQGPNVAGGSKLSTYRNDTTGTVEKLSRADGKVSIQAISTTTTIANPGVRYIEADSSGGAITITIPWGGWYQEAQEPLIIKDVGGAASAFNITLQVGSGANIGSSTSLVMDQDGQTVILMPSGSTGTGAWRILYDSSDTGGVTGSGSAGYAAIWNGASSLTFDSLYYDTTNNRLSVNAGTSPTYTIEANLSTGATIAATSTTNSVIAGLQADGANSRAIVGALSGHPTLFYGGGAEGARLTAARLFGINNTGPTSQLDVTAADTLTNPLTVRDSSSVALVDISPYGRQTHVVQNENAVGGNGYFAFQNGNQTGLTSGAGVVGMTYDLGGTRDWTGSVPATQREVYYYAPVYSATSTSTMTNAVTLGIDGPPTAGTNVTITNAYALEVASGHFKLGGSTSASELRFLEPSGSGANYTAFKAQAQSGNVTYTLPAADGTSGYCLSTNGSGTLSWVSCAGGGGTIGGSATATYVSYGSGANTITGESAFTYDATNNILSFVKWSGAGLDLDTDVNNTAALVDGSFSIIKNDSNLRTFHGIYVNPVLNTGGSNLQTTVNILSVDTTNTATTGLTTNLLNLAYGGTTVFTVTSTGSMTLADGVKQTFNPNGTNAGINVGSQAGDPSSLANGDIWYNSTSNKFKCRENGSTVDCIGSGSGGLTVGTTAIASGTAGRILYETSGNVLGEIAGSSADADGAVQFAATARTSGVAQYFRINTPADTTLTASTESVGVYIGGNGSGSTVTRQWSTGALTTQREYVFVAPTYAFAGASTLTEATTLYVSGPPTAGTNATITRRHGVSIDAVAGSSVPAVAPLAIGANLATSGTVSTTALMRLGPSTANTIFTVDYSRDAAGNNGLAIGRTQTGFGQARLDLLSGAGSSGDAYLSLYSNSYSAFSSTQQGAALLRIKTSTSGSGKVGFIVVDENGGRFGVVGDGVIIGSPRGNTTSGNTANAELDVVSGSASRVGLRVDSAASPSVDVFRVSADNGTTTHFKVTSTGAASLAGTAAGSYLVLTGGTYDVGIQLTATSATKYIFIDQSADQIFLGSQVPGTAGPTQGVRVRGSGQSYAFDVGGLSSGGTSPGQINIASLQTTRPAIYAESLANTSVALAQYYLNANDTNTVAPHSVFSVDSNGTAATGFGGQLQFQLESSTTNQQDAAAINWIWTDATHASRTSALVISTVNSAAALAEVARFNGAGGMTLSAVLFTNLPSSTDGTLIYCSDCQVTSGADNTCAGSGSGALAFRRSGAWRCFDVQN